MEIDVEHLKVYEVHIRCRKIFDLFQESSILSYSFDTAVEGALSKIMFVNMMSFLCIQITDTIWKMYFNSKVTITVTKNQSKVLLDKITQFKEFILLPKKKL
jgi:hypothetical protein